MQNGRLRRIRDRINPGIPEDFPGQSGTVRIQHGPDPAGIFDTGGAVADDDQLNFQRCVHHSRVSAGPAFRFIGCCDRIRSRVLQDRPVDDIPVPRRPGYVFRLGIGLMDQGSRLR